jgi:DNA repair exonuclease SbcCD ATPase subunit
MSTQLPRLEARVSAQERRQLILDARIEELSQDMTAISGQQASCQSLEARVSAQERMQTALHARIEELSQDVTASFRQLADYQIQTEHQIDARFDKVDARFDKVDARFDKVDARFDKVEARVVAIEANMATKEDMTTMEGRMLDAFKQLLTVIDSRLPPPQE